MGKKEDEVELFLSTPHKKKGILPQQCYFALGLAVGISITVLAAVCIMYSGQLPMVFSSEKHVTCTVFQTAPQCQIVDNDRYDCWPEYWNATEEACTARGCCWNPSVTVQGVPYCFYPSNYDGYRVTAQKATSSGITANLSRSTKTIYPDDIMKLRIDVMYETKERVRFKIYDPKNARYEVPLDISQMSAGTAMDTDYIVTIQEQPFAITVIRKQTKEPLFDSSKMAPLIFSDQYLQIGTKLSSKNIFGIGEHRNNFLLNTSWNKIVLWTRDQPPIMGENLYGAHPFYLNLERDNKAHGVFLLNSNAMEIDLQPNPDTTRAALTYRSIGGVLDFYVFTGPNPDEVVEQYVSLIGKPFLPPFWALGFHLCKYGYNSAAELKKVIARNRAAHIPYDGQWTDIDAMDRNLDWTYDKTTFADLPEIVADLHSHGQRYIVITDPGISSTNAGKYPPYDEGITDDVFIKNQDGSLLIGKVWPGETVFPDFFHPNASDWWYRQVYSFYKQVPFDAVWTDMNEPSNEVLGSIKGCTRSSLDVPPFTPPDTDGGTLLSRTLCLSAKQYLSTHYNLHNLYGFSQMRATMQALQKIREKRSMVMSRSTFSGSGRHGGHWLGDNISTWSDLYYSIPGILNFQLFGVPLVGADVCGHFADTTQELCIRWMQLGSFYPFMRNQGSSTSSDQDPGVFDSKAQAIMRSVLRTRYSLLPFLYTLFYRSHVNASLVARPLMFSYPELQSVDKQFLWGSSLLITPVLEQGATTVTGYIPSDRWYDFYNGTILMNSGQWVTLDAPLNKINLHVRGGSILPMLPPAITTNHMRKEKFNLKVAMSEVGTAAGELYWDDGEELNVVEKKHFSLISFYVTANTLTNTVEAAHYSPQEGIILGNVTVMGVAHRPTHVTVNKKPVSFNYFQENMLLTVDNLSIDMLQLFTINW